MTLGPADGGGAPTVGSKSSPDRKCIARRDQNSCRKSCLQSYCIKRGHCIPYVSDVSLVARNYKTKLIAANERSDPRRVNRREGSSKRARYSRGARPIESARCAPELHRTRAGRVLVIRVRYFKVLRLGRLVDQSEDPRLTYTAATPRLDRPIRSKRAHY